MAQHPNSIIVDGNDSPAPDLKALVGELSNERAAPADKAGTPAKESDPDWLPAKWKGKSEKERAEMYKNLESVYGRVANDLGQQRKITDQILFDKRERDLGRDPAKAEQPKRKLSITAAELLEKPSEVLERELGAIKEEVVNSVRSVLNEKDANTAEAQFYAKHSDAAEIVSSPEFVEFVNSSPSRSRLAALVRQNGDAETADALLTEFKEARKSAAKPQDEQDRARGASFESSSARAPTAPRKIYRRADLIKLKMTDPDSYAELNDEILRAYAEGRVK